MDQPLTVGLADVVSDPADVFKAKKPDLHTLLTCFDSCRCESSVTPRSCTADERVISTSPNVSSGMTSQFLANLDDKCMTPVLSELQARPFLVHQTKMFTTHLSSLETMTDRSSTGLTNT